MRKRFILLILICTLFSCTDKNKIPSEVIPSKEMSSILWDLLNAQALANEAARKDSSLNVESQTKTLTKKVFEIHQISSTTFDKSYDWYSGHPNVFKLLFDSLYTQKQRDNELGLKERYSRLKNDSISRKFIKK